MGRTKKTSPIRKRHRHLNWTFTQRKPNYTHPYRHPDTGSTDWAGDRTRELAELVKTKNFINYAKVLTVQDAEGTMIKGYIELRHSREQHIMKQMYWADRYAVREGTGRQAREALHGGREFGIPKKAVGRPPLRIAPGTTADGELSRMDLQIILN